MPEDVDVVDPPAPETVTDKTFTQAEVDRIIQERLARAKTSPPPDYDELKTKAAKLDELEQANQSELDKILARAEAAEKKAADAIQRARDNALRSTIVTEALKAGAVDPDDVFALLPNKDALTIGDDDRVEGVEEAVKALLEAKPHLVGKPATPSGSADGGPRGSKDGPRQLTRDDLASMSPEQISAARAAGQLNQLMGLT